MQYIPIKTRIMQPPQDDLFAVLKESIKELHEGDVVFISSKIVAIGEGRCVPLDEVDKEAVVQAEADLIIPRDYWGSPLTLVHNVFISGAGVDKSNGNEHLILLPEDPFKSVKEIHQFLKEAFAVENIGVVITDIICSCGKACFGNAGVCKSINHSFIIRGVCCFKGTNIPWSVSCDTYDICTKCKCGIG